KIDDKDVTARKVAGKLERILLEKGYSLVDKSQFANVRARDLALGDTNATKAKELGRRFGAELVIAGGAQAVFSEERDTYGIKSIQYTADGEVKLILTDVGEILAVASASATKAAQGKSNAASKSLEELGTLLAADISAKLDAKMKESKEKPFVVQLALLGVNDASLVKIEEELPGKISQIQRMKLRYMEGDAAVFDVWIKGSIDDLRKTFSGMPDYKVEAFTGSRLDVNTKAQGGKAKASYAVPTALDITEFKVENIFPAQFAWYAMHPIGSVTIQNTGKVDVKNIKAQLFMPAYMQMASEQIIPLLKAGEKKSFAVSATLDREKLLGVSENTVSQMKAEITYAVGGKEETRSLTKPVTVYNKNAVSWSKPNTIGAFITYKDEAVQNFSRSVIGSVKYDASVLPAASRNQVNAMKVWEAVRAIQIHYVSDPWVVAEGDVLDEIAFPRQTLSKKAGDCDDTSVLLAACLENIGIRTMLVGTADHVFMMFDAQVNKKNAARVSLNERDYVVLDNTVWIPLETTIINKSFAEAWKLGAEGYYKVKESGGKLDLIDVRKAWETSPPTNLASNEALPEPPAADAVAALLATEAKDIAQVQGAAVNAKIAELKAKNTEAGDNEAARYLANAGRYEEAIALLSAYTSAMSRNNRGNVYLLKGDSVSAVKNYTAAMKSDAEDGGICLNMGLLLYLGGDHEGTVNSFAAAVAKFPSMEAAYAELGIENIMAEMAGSKAAERGATIDRGELRSLLFSALQDVAAKKNSRAATAHIRRGENRFVFGGRRGIEPTALANINDFLYWKMS
ncbi:MAG: hypothetical protein NTV54_00425, partial [Ignavibacteriales bacterium]|nr:hypothetical protein [Ignavibacteriales bacterium]